MQPLTVLRERGLSVVRGLRAFLYGRRAVSTVEYALITIAVVSIVGGAIILLGDAFTGLFGELGTELNTARSAAVTAGGT